MYCKNCGITVNGTYCPRCGSMTVDINNVAPNAVRPGTASAHPNSPSVLKWAILGLAFCGWPILNIMGIVFGAIAKSKALEFQSLNGSIFGSAKVGRILGNIAFIVGIVMTVIYFIYFVIIFAAVLSTV